VGPLQAIAPGPVQATVFSGDAFLRLWAPPGAGAPDSRRLPSPHTTRLFRPVRRRRLPRLSSPRKHLSLKSGGLPKPVCPNGRPVGADLLSDQCCGCTAGYSGRARSTVAKLRAPTGTPGLRRSRCGAKRSRSATSYRARAERIRRISEQRSVAGQLSMAIGFSPLVAIVSPRWWPADVPTGGHRFSPSGVGCWGSGQGPHPFYRPRPAHPALECVPDSGRLATKLRQETLRAFIVEAPVSRRIWTARRRWPSVCVGKLSSEASPERKPLCGRFLAEQPRNPVRSSHRRSSPLGRAVGPPRRPRTPETTRRCAARTTSRTPFVPRTPAPTSARRRRTDYPWPLSAGLRMWRS
jgi:hypothetical protein